LGAGVDGAAWEGVRPRLLDSPTPCPLRWPLPARGLQRALRGGPRAPGPAGGSAW
jgi:hypothetical protein